MMPEGSTKTQGHMKKPPTTNAFGAGHLSLIFDVFNFKMKIKGVCLGGLVS